MRGREREEERNMSIDSLFWTDTKSVRNTGIERVKLGNSTKEREREREREREKERERERERERKIGTFPVNVK